MITGVCDNVSIYAACIIGAYAGIFYLKVRQVFIRNNIDDPMQSAQIHGLCGFMGVLNTGLFGQNTETQDDGNINTFEVVGIQFVGAVFLGLWAMVVSYAFFKILSNMGHLRVGQFYEIVGIDILTHTMSDLIGMEDTFLKDSKRFISLKSGQKFEEEVEMYQQQQNQQIKSISDDSEVPHINNTDERSVVE